MAIDYYGAFPCKVREAISDADLLRMEKARNQAAFMVDRIRNTPEADRSKPESEWTFKSVVLGPDGPQTKELGIADLLAEAAPLDALAPHCAGCPANLRASDFGCGGAIHYPIRAPAERWLVSRLPSDLSGTRGQLLLRAIADFKFDGAAIDAARTRKELYDCAAPEVRIWGSFFSKKTRITSSQILHMAFNVGSMEPMHAKLVAYFLGFLNDEFQPDTSAANLPQAGDDSGVVELKYFFLVAALAGASGIPVLIDA